MALMNASDCRAGATTATLWLSVSVALGLGFSFAIFTWYLLDLCVFDKVSMIL
jgi:hypothetical protein